MINYLRLNYDIDKTMFTLHDILLSSLPSFLPPSLFQNFSCQYTPAVSRAENKDCVLLDFYDNHDVWHFVSSNALFFSFLVSPDLLVLILDFSFSNSHSCFYIVCPDVR